MKIIASLLITLFFQNVFATPDIDMEIKSIIIHTTDDRSITIKIDSSATLCKLAYAQLGGDESVVPDYIINKIQHVDLFSIYATKSIGDVRKDYIYLKFEYYSEDDLNDNDELLSNDFGAYELKVTFLNDEFSKATITDTNSNKVIKEFFIGGSTPFPRTL